jgi:signal transduction histidine kinase
MMVAWIVELSGVRWPRPALIAAVVLPNVWLTLIGHTSTNYLFLSLLVAWVGVVGTRAEGALALALSLATVGLAEMLDLISGIVTWWSPWVSWSAGLVMVWLMALVLGRQERLVAELHRLAVDNARLQERARQAAILEERQRLARELHDSVTQALYGISLYVEAAARALADGEQEPAAASLREIRDTTQEAQGEMRLLLFELRPPLLEAQGLAAALRVRLQAVEARSGLVADCDCQGEERLQPEQEQELYRLAQEALNNVLKHAHAQHVHVRLAVASDRATLDVADDGIGFDPALQGADGYGLPGMRERAKRLGGTLQIVSALGEGTCVHVEIPR